MPDFDECILRSSRSENERTIGLRRLEQAWEAQTRRYGSLLLDSPLARSHAHMIKLRQEAEEFERALERTEQVIGQAMIPLLRAFGETGEELVNFLRQYAGSGS